MSVLQYIQENRHVHKPLLAVLLDPDKAEACEAVFPYLHSADMVLVGGSTATESERLVTRLKGLIEKPVVLFPGNAEQFAPNADALLFLSMLTARTADVLIEPHIAVARRVKQSGIETIPMGYILLDGGRSSSVQRTTHSVPIAQEDVDEVVRTAVAAELLGKRLLYLEAGSGALKPVCPSVISAVEAATDTPLLVGGGIRTLRQMTEAYIAGADIVVIGNHFERHPEQLSMFVEAKNAYANH